MKQEPTEQEHETYLSPSQVAEALNVNNARVYALIKSGKLKAHRITPRLVRVCRSDLDAMVKRSEAA